ncbi:MAG: Fe-S cluster assembly protein SufD [Fimbriimonadaceae bacterium]|nr:Fe-S cluster assembly protein SufD [Fimbriimonadaceae bacterium]
MVELQDRTTTPFDGIFSRFERRTDQPAWLSELRSKGLAAWDRQGIPTTKHEEWKYTSLRELSEHHFLPAEPAALTSGDLSTFAYAEDAIRIAVINGRLDHTISSKLNDVEGLTVEEVCLNSDKPTLLGEIADVDANPFAALNAALVEHVIVIRVAKSAVIERPIEIMAVMTAGSDAVAAFPRFVLIAEESSQATVVETYGSIGVGATFQSVVLEADIAKNAVIEHIRVQRESLDANHISLTQVRQERDSTYRHFSVTFGGKLTRNDTNVFLNGSNLHCRLDGVYVQNGTQVCDNHTRLDHAYPHCDSFEVYKGVLSDHARGVFNGKIYVHQDAQKTDAKQTNQVILLSPTASIDTKPQLEIYADDVKCTHGATVGQLRDEALFYLRSRGIPLAEARALLVYAFAAEVLEKIECEPVRVTLERLLYEKLGN